MIDIESEVFDTVYNALRAVYPSISMSSEYVAAAASFPAVSLIEMSNTPVRRAMTQESHEPYAAVSYEINVYSDKARGRKKEAKAIAVIVDDTMLKLGFLRTLYAPVPNYADGNIFRLSIRYNGVVDKDHKVYRPQ